MKVLIADGSLMVTQRLTSLMLEIPHLELLLPTATGEATLESVRAHDPEVLIIDAGVLHGKGSELLKTVRQEKPAIVVIVLSNLFYPQYRQHYEAAGANLFLDKSNEFIHLYQFIRELVRDSRSAEGSGGRDGFRKRLARTKLRVGLQLVLFAFSVSSLFVGPRDRGAVLGLAPADGGVCPCAQKVAIHLEGKHVRDSIGFWDLQFLARWLAFSRHAEGVDPSAAAASAPWVAIAPTSLSFSSVSLGSSSATQVVTISNSGTATLMVKSIPVDNSAFALSTLALPVSQSPAHSFQIRGMTYFLHPAV